MRCEKSTALRRPHALEHLHDDNELARAIARLRSETVQNEGSGVLVTWHGPWSYSLELSHQIPPGLVYECLAPEQLNFSDCIQDRPD